MLFDDFSFFSSGSHFVQQGKTILATLVYEHEKHFCEIILKLGHWPRRRSGLKIFLFFSSGGHFFCRAEPF